MKHLTEKLWGILFALCALCLIPACSDDDDPDSPGELPTNVQKYMSYPEGLSDDGNIVVQKQTVGYDEEEMPLAAPVKRVETSIKRNGVEATVINRYHFTNASNNGKLSKADGIVATPQAEWATVIMKVLKEQAATDSTMHNLKNIRQDGRCVYYDIIISEEMKETNKSDFIIMNGGLAEDPSNPSDSTDIDEPSIPSDSTDVDNPDIQEPDTTQSGGGYDPNVPFDQVPVSGLTRPNRFVGTWISYYRYYKEWDGEDYNESISEDDFLKWELKRSGDITFYVRDYDKNDEYVVDTKSKWGYKEGKLYVANPEEPEGYSWALLEELEDGSIEITSKYYFNGHEAIQIIRYRK